MGVVIEVNAETDFVAKNADFQAFVKTCADTVIEQNPADVEALLACKAAGTEETVDALLKEKILTIGENIKIRRFARYEGAVTSYVHAGGRIGVIAWRRRRKSSPSRLWTRASPPISLRRLWLAV